MNFQLWAASKLGRLEYSLRRRATFYAPLTEHLDFMGIDPVNFTRVYDWVATRRDGLVHNVAANVPRFEFDGERALGIGLFGGETLQYSAQNGLNDANTLIWFEDGVGKSTPVNTNPINSSGFWAGNLNIHLRDLTKFNTVLSSEVIGSIYSAFADPDPVTPPPDPGPTPPTVSGTAMQEVPSGTRNGSNTVFTLSQNPNLNTLILVCFGTVVERVASAPGNMEFTLSGTGNRTITMGMAPLTNYPFFATYFIA